MRDGKRCDECAHWLNGECRALPPGQVGWPVVRADQWCSYWKGLIDPVKEALADAVLGISTTSPADTLNTRGEKADGSRGRPRGINEADNLSTHGEKPKRAGRKRKAGA